MGPILGVLARTGGRQLLKKGATTIMRSTVKRTSRSVAKNLVDRRASRMVRWRNLGKSKQLPKTIDVEAAVVKQPGRLARWGKYGKDLLIQVGVWAAIDQGISYFFGDNDEKEANGQDPSNSQGGGEGNGPRLATGADAEDFDQALYNMTGHPALTDAYSSGNGRDKWISSGQQSLSAIIDDVLFSKASIAGAELPASLSGRIEGLTDSQRVIAISFLVRAAKEIALYSRSDIFFLTLLRQFSASSISNASPTESLIAIIKDGNITDPATVAIMEEQSLMYETLYEEVRDANADDYYNEASTIWDLFDLIPRDIKVEPETVRALQLSMLASDDTTASQVGWFDKWKADKDRDDDEGNAVKVMTYWSSVANRYTSFVSSIMQDDDSKSDSLLYNL